MVASEFADAMVGLTYEQRVQLLNNIGDALRECRQIVNDIRATDIFIDRSTRSWTTPTKATIKADIEVEPANGQTETLYSKAEALFTVLEEA